MKKVDQILARLIKDDSGHDVVEHALAVAMAAMTTLAI